jgi:hypothetical protein
MEPTEFTFKNDLDMTVLVKNLATSLAEQVGSTPDKIKCKGLRFFFVDEEKDMLLSTGLFVAGFCPEDWDDDCDA